MKLHLTTILIFLLVGLTRCNNSMYPNGTFKAKLVASFCAFHIVEIQDTAFYGQGMDWTDSKGKKYEHVFAVKNHCDFAQAGLKAGDVFICKILTEEGANNCAVCMGFMETPPLQKNVKVMSAEVR
jgi:hypothetical protein